MFLKLLQNVDIVNIGSRLPSSLKDAIHLSLYQKEAGRALKCLYNIVEEG
jgi:hypothetical protein